MKTAAQREEEFRRDLEALLEKHGADLSIGDDGKPWGMHCGIANISMWAEYDDQNNCIAEFTDFNI